MPQLQQPSPLSFCLTGAAKAAALFLLYAAGSTSSAFSPSLLTRRYHHYPAFVGVTFKTTSSNNNNNSPLLLFAIQGAGVGISNLDDTQEAVAEAVQQALQGAGVSTVESNGDVSSLSSSSFMAFVSATVSRDVKQVQKAFAQQLPAGCQVHGITSSAALLQPGKGSVPKAVGCLLLNCDSNCDFVTAFHESDGRQAVMTLHQKLSAQRPPQAIYMSATPGAEEGILEILSQEFPGVPVFGGTAADDKVSGAWQVFDAAAATSGTGIALTAIGSSVRFGASMVGPYTPTSKTAVATKTNGGRRVYEINSKPAVDWVYEWLGEQVKEQYENGGLILAQTAQKPIAVQKAGVEDYITAHCGAFSGLAPDNNNGETFVDFFVPVPQGSTLTVMDSGNGPFTGYATALSQAHEIAAAAVAPKTTATSSPFPKAGLLVYCGGMAIAVGDQLDAGLTSPDFAARVQGLPCLGMTCFGEQAYLPQSKTNVHRNLSVGMILFG